jgi:hypothetical protein
MCLILTQLHINFVLIVSGSLSAHSLFFYRQIIYEQQIQPVEFLQPSVS